MAKPRSDQTSNPRIEGLVPPEGKQDQKYQVDLHGANFDTQGGTPTVTFAAGITVKEVVPQHAGHLIVSIRIAENASVKKYPVTVTNSDGGTDTKQNAFEVGAAS